MYRTDELVFGTFCKLTQNNGRSGKWPYGPTIGPLTRFTEMRHLGITVSALLGPKRLWEGSKERNFEGPPFRLVDALPKGLESLHLYSYEKGDCDMYDGHVDELMAQMAEKLPLLKEIKGVEEPLWMPSSKYLDLDITDDENFWKHEFGGKEWEEAS